VPAATSADSWSQWADEVMRYGFLAEPSPPPKVDAAHVVATLSSNVSSNNAVRQRFLFITILLVFLTLLFTGAKVQKISDYQTPFFYAGFDKNTHFMRNSPVEK